MLEINLPHQICKTKTFIYTIIPVPPAVDEKYRVLTESVLRLVTIEIFQPDKSENKVLTMDSILFVFCYILQLSTVKILIKRHSADVNILDQVTMYSKSLQTLLKKTPGKNSFQCSNLPRE